MKKLMMFAAAVTIVGSAFAQCGEVPSTPCALVYDVKFSVKTTVAKEIAGEKIPCGESVSSLCYRTPGSASWKGFLATCSCDCYSFLQAEMVLWDDKAQEFVVDGIVPQWFVFNLIGKKNTDVEAYFEVEDEYDNGIYAAGFGKWDDKYSRLSSLSGNFAAMIPPPECLSGEICGPAIAFPCGLNVVPTLDFTIGYGTFSIKYNKSASGKLAELGVYPAPRWY